MRVFIADPRAAIRGALTIFLELDPGVHVVGEAGDDAELLPGLALARPDVVLLEWELLPPSADPLANIRAQAPGAQVIVLNSRPEVQRLAYAAGADGFISKAELPDQLRASLRGIALRARAQGVEFTERAASG